VNSFSFIIIFTLIFFTSQLKGQSVYKSIPINDKFSKKEIVIKKDLSLNTPSSLSCYLALQYDFQDSIFIYIGGKLVSKYNLRYILPDTDASIYPYNRKILKLSQNCQSDYGKYCTMVFPNKKIIAEFILCKGVTYYSLGMKEKSTRWNMIFLNSFPWD